MRPISTEQNALRYPLDEVLGTESHVRLLRVFAHEVGAPLGVSDAAKRAGLTPAGARKALKRLEEASFVVRVGGGRTQQYALRGQEPLLQTLTSLFLQEEQRYDEFIRSLRDALVGLHEMRVAWIESFPLRAGDALEVVLVTEAKSIGWIAEEVRTRLLGLEKEFNLIIEVAAFTRADAPEPRVGALMLWTAEPNETISGTREQPPMHSDRESRSLLMAQGVAELIRSDPSLVKRAMRHLNGLIHEGQGTATGDIAEWRQLLEAYSPERVRDLLVSRSSRADRLRQSSPFFAVLTPDERDRLLSLIEKRR